MKQKQNDVFRSYLVRNADYEDEFDIPVLYSSNLIPNQLIPFSKAMTTKNHSQWVHFYENDIAFLRIWRQPRKYLKILKKFYGVISPDFSLQRNMPLIMQMWSTYMGRALGNFWQHNGIEVIPNVRFNDDRTYNFAFNGLDKNANLAISSLGSLKNKEERRYFISGLEVMLKTLTPKNLMVYGSTPENIFGDYKKETNIIQFPSRISCVHSKVVAE